MPIDLKIPEVGESVTEVEIGRWLKAEGDSVAQDENLVTLESEKATVELPSPVAGRLAKVLKRNGQTAKIGEVVARIETDGRSESGKSDKTPAPKAAEREGDGESRKADRTKATAPEQKRTETRAIAEADKDKAAREEKKEPPPVESVKRRVMPAAQRLLAERGLHAENIEATGPGGRLLKEDVLRHIESRETAPPGKAEQTQVKPTAVRASMDSREEEVVPMSPLRRTVARRLVEAQQTMAILTTFNEMDMSSVVALRKEHQDAFQARYGVKLGFMSFFVKAVIDALKLVPQLNAGVRGNDIVYHNYFDVGVAIGTGKGLAVPVLKNAERMSFAEIELAIADFAQRAKENKLKLEELQGGTFTITNGGVYGSLLSTPIINPPQSGILGMHTIQDRPIALQGNVIIRPMMYVALSYDHRLVDGREAVTFLKRVKEVIENPARMLIEI